MLRDEEGRGSGDGHMLPPTGQSLASRLLSHFLFPASKMILESEEPRQPGIININPLYVGHMLT